MSKSRANATGTNAKGDIIVATGSATAASVTVGSNGQIVVADSTQASGVKWSAGDTDQIILATQVFS